MLWVLGLYHNAATISPIVRRTESYSTTQPAAEPVSRGKDLTVLKLAAQGLQHSLLPGTIANTQRHS